MAHVHVRLAERQDLDRLVEIEAASTPSVRYIAEVEEEFYDPARGELIVAEVDGVLAGFVHYSVQYDQAAWIETLRVDPPFQKKGAGAAMWSWIMDICNRWNPPAIRMYTNITNDGSIKLAYQCGLGIRLNTHEYELALDGVDLPSDHGFMRVASEDVQRVLAPYIDGYKGYYCTNRTYYEMNEALYLVLGEDEKVWMTSDAVAVVGSRYRHNTALHVGMLCGNIDKCIDFAVAEGIRQGVPKVVCMIPNNRQDLADALRSHGFKLNGNDIIMMERIFT